MRQLWGLGCRWLGGMVAGEAWYAGKGSLHGGEYA